MCDSVDGFYTYAYILLYAYNKFQNEIEFEKCFKNHFLLC